MAGYSVTYTVVDNATKQIDAINRRMAAMRAPMERLSKQVSRFVDVSGLKKIGDGFRWIADSAKEVLRSLVEIVPVLGTITGAATIAGLVKLVSTFSDWAKQLSVSADSMGITTQQLQQFQDAARLAGGNADDMTQAMRAFYKVQTDFVRGQASAESIGWLNRLGVNVRDATGHLRNMSEIMPEVISKIAAIQNPADRAAASAALLGDANMKLVEAFRTSHRSFLDWMTDAGRYTALTDDQREALEAFGRAQDRASVAFSHLGQQISATLAKNFEPLLTRLSEFVEKHTPEIIAAVDRISTEFANWLGNVDWTKVGDDLQMIVDNLGKIETTAEVVAGIFATKWALGMVADITKVAVALGPIGAVLTAAAALAGVVAVNKAGQKDIDDKAKAMGFEKGGDATNPTYRNAQTGETLSYTEMMQRQGKMPEGYSSEGYSPGQQSVGRFFRRLIEGPFAGTPYDTRTKFEPQAKDITPEARGLLKTIAGGESKGDYGILYGGGHFTGTQFPEWSGKDNSHAAGAYQFQPGTFREVQAATGIKDFSPENQDRAAWYLAQRDYAKRTGGRSLQTDLQDPSKADQIASVLGPTWTSTRNAGWAGQLRANERTAVAAAPPAPAPAGPPGRINGQVDVAVTMKNAPPDTAITAKGSGAVNVAPPRVEHQDLVAA